MSLMILVIVTKGKYIEGKTPLHLNPTRGIVTLHNENPFPNEFIPNNISSMYFYMQIKLYINIFPF